MTRAFFLFKIPPWVNFHIKPYFVCCLTVSEFHKGENCLIPVCFKDGSRLFQKLFFLSLDRKSWQIQKLTWCQYWTCCPSAHMDNKCFKFKSKCCSPFPCCCRNCCSPFPCCCRNCCSPFHCCCLTCCNSFHCCCLNCCNSFHCCCRNCCNSFHCCCLCLHCRRVNPMVLVTQRLTWMMMMTMTMMTAMGQAWCKGCLVREDDRNQHSKMLMTAISKSFITCTSHRLY